MSWVKSDDQMSIHRKVQPLSDAAYRLQDEARLWCSRNLTDGRIPADEFEVCSLRATPENAAELVKRKLWHRAEDGHCGHDKCAIPGPDGWVIHDYLEYNPAAAEVIAERAKKADRNRRYMEKINASRKSTGASKDASSAPSVDATVDRAEDAAIDASKDAPLTTPPSPSPPRREAGDGVPRGGTPLAASRQAGASSEPDQNQDRPKSRHVPSDGRADLAEARRAIAEARSKIRHTTPGAGGLERLRQAAPDAPTDLVAEPETGAA